MAVEDRTCAVVLAYSMARTPVILSDIYTSILLSYTKALLYYQIQTVAPVPLETSNNLTKISR